MGEPTENSLWISLWDVDAMSKWRGPEAADIPTWTLESVGSPWAPSACVTTCRKPAEKEESPQREEREN